MAGFQQHGSRNAGVFAPSIDRAVAEKAAGGGRRAAENEACGKVVLQLGRERVARAFAYAALARHDEVHAVGAPFADKLA